MQLGCSQLQDLADQWPEPRLRLGLSSFPANDRGALAAEGFCKSFLGIAKRLAALRKTQPL